MSKRVLRDQRRRDDAEREHRDEREPAPRSSRRRGPAATAAPSLRGLGDQLDLDAGAERQLRDAEGAACMRALLGEDLAISSEQPLVTRWCSVKSGALLTRLIS